MDIIAIAVLIIGLIAGYSLLQQHRERQLAERLKKMHDAKWSISEIDSAILQSRQEAEFFKRNSSHHL